MTATRPQVALSDTDAATIARAAGVTVPAARLSRFAQDLAGVRELIAEIDALALPQPAVPAGPYDPAWPGGNEARR